MEILKLLLQPIIIAAIVSAVVSITINSVFKKERMRRFSVVFDDRYNAYKAIFRMLIEIEEESQFLILYIEDGDWRSYASAIHKINTTVKEIRRIAILNSFIIDREILNEITSDQFMFESFGQYDIPPQGASMHENKKEELLTQSQEISKQVIKIQKTMHKIFKKRM